jgi:DNA-binding transcriptional LysR family regulator
MDLLAQMATFVSVVEGKSLSAAARAQRLSLPAVSRQLQALEADLGTSLIVRSTRRLHVTDAGLQWYEHCRRTLRDIESARDAVRGSKAVRGMLVVSASLTFGSEVIVPRLHGLLERWLPRLENGCDGWLVVQRNLGSDSLHRWLQATFPDAFSFVRAATNKGYRVLRARKR